MQIDKILENHVGSFGRYQKLLEVLLSLCALLGCLYTMEILFSAGKMEHWCKVPQPLEGPLSNLTKDEWRNITIPRIYKEDKWQYDSCTMYNANFSDVTNINSLQNISTSSCSQFDYDTSNFESSIVSEWNVVCNKGSLVSLMKSILMASKSISLIFGGFVSDRFGRKRALCVMSGLMVIGRIGISLAPSLVFFVIFNSLSVFAVTSLYVVAFTLGVELVGPQWRGFVGIMPGEAYATGFIVLAGVAYLCRTRMILHIANTVLMVIMVPILWLVPESPRWLAVRGREKAAMQVLETMARRNGNCLPPDISVECMVEKSEDPNRTVNTLVKLMRNGKIIVVRVFIIIPAWFCANLTYYGLTWNIQSFAGSMYVNLAIAGALELVGALFGQMIISTRLGRRLPTCVLYVLSGLTLLLIIAVPSDKKNIASVLAVCGRTFCVAYFNTLYVWTAEIFPSTVRTTAISCASVVGKVGGILAPFLAEMSIVAEWFPMALLGGLGLLSGVLLMFIPETRGKPLVQTLDEMLSQKEEKSTTA